jgi:hypothetical protein
VGIACIIGRLLQQVPVIGVRCHLGEDQHTMYVLLGRACQLWGRQGISRVASGRQPARSEVDPPTKDGPGSEGQRVAFAAGLLYAFGDPGGRVVQSADHCQQVCVEHPGIGMCQRRFIRVGEWAKLFEAA